MKYSKYQIQSTLTQ